jgi:hypothetical protein
MMPSFKIDEVDKKELAEKFSTMPSQAALRKLCNALARRT